MNGVNLVETDKPQCQYFVQRKKRLCRMTVRPGRSYCGEHDPGTATEIGKLETSEGIKPDLRVPCPLDPKHTCYASKLARHLEVCNLRQREQPDYIQHNINVLENVDVPARRPLSEIPQEELQEVIRKINDLYERFVAHEITDAPEYEIHEAVLEEFREKDRTETSLRHLRQVSSLLHIIEDEGLSKDGTCYVELGAGKGHLSYHAHRAWCARQPASRALLIDRAALRHKRDNKLRAPASAASPAPPAPAASPTSDVPPLASASGELGNSTPPAPAAPVRLRADLAHVRLRRAGPVRECARLLGLAKHLCGVAADYALRCVLSAAAEGAGAAAGAVGAGAEGAVGVVLLTCCHHRCELGAYIGYPHLQALGLSGRQQAALLGAASWATCGDGRARGADKEGGEAATDRAARARTGRRAKALLDCTLPSPPPPAAAARAARARTGRRAKALLDCTLPSPPPPAAAARAARARTGRRAKALLDCTLPSPPPPAAAARAARARTGRRAKALLDCTLPSPPPPAAAARAARARTGRRAKALLDCTLPSPPPPAAAARAARARTGRRAKALLDCTLPSPPPPAAAARAARARTGRRAKALLDWGRARALSAAGLRARLVRCVPAAVTKENLCIVAKS